MSTSSAARKAKHAALLEKFREEREGCGDRVVPRRFRKPILPVTDEAAALPPQRRRAYSDEGILDSLSAALERAEEVMDRRALPLHEALDEVNFETASHQDYSRRSSSSVQSVRSSRSHTRRPPSRRSARREREKEEAKLRAHAALPMHYRLRKASPAKRIGFFLAVIALHAAACALLATFHTWPAARPFLSTAVTEFRWTAHRWTGAESRPVDAVLSDLRYVSEKREKTIGEIDRLQDEASSAEEAGEMAFVIKALGIKASSEMEKVVKLRKELQFLSREAVIEHFGEGPHYVQFDLDFSSGSTDVQDDGPTSFVVQMAPLSAAPHSVHVFLEQISQSFWDGKSFMLNPGHLIMATSPLVKNGERTPEVEALGEARATAPAFPEYSEAYPHRPLTLGFVASRPAPHFYVNTKDNAEIHGPGKQVHHADAGSADPCFAEVVAGLDAVERIRGMPTKSGGPWLKGKVRIQSARIVPNPSGESDQI